MTWIPVHPDQPRPRWHNDRLREQACCDCPCHTGRPDLCNCYPRKPRS